MTAESIAQALGGCRHSGTGYIARCPSHPDRTPSLKISDSNETNDGISVHCFAGCDWKDVKDELRSRGLLPEFEPGQSTQRPPQPRRTVAEPDQQKLVNIDHAQEIWAASSPAAGTHAETYLRGRGITIAIPPTIKSNPSLKHGPTGLFFPAMIAAISGTDKKITGIHRTYLRLDGTGKATVSEPKMALGRAPGDAVRLGPAAEEIGICEGIETGLSAMQLYGGPVWCACGSHIDKIVLPNQVKHVRIYADNGEAGERNAERAAEIFYKQVCRVTIVRPIDAYEDFNDCLQAQVRRAA